jgi:hypothetical protein
LPDCDAAGSELASQLRFHLQSQFIGKWVDLFVSGTKDSSRAIRLLRNSPQIEEIVMADPRASNVLNIVKI